MHACGPRLAASGRPRGQHCMANALLHVRVVVSCCARVQHSLARFYVGLYLAVREASPAVLRQGGTKVPHWPRCHESGLCALACCLYGVFVPCLHAVLGTLKSLVAAWGTGGESGVEECIICVLELLVAASSSAARAVTMWSDVHDDWTVLTRLCCQNVFFPP